jgi:hypothetical protein
MHRSTSALSSFSLSLSLLIFSPAYLFLADSHLFAEESIRPVSVELLSDRAVSFFSMCLSRLKLLSTQSCARVWVRRSLTARPGSWAFDLLCDGRRISFPSILPHSLLFCWIILHFSASTSTSVLHREKIKTDA